MLSDFQRKFCQEGAVFKWQCPACHKQNNIRVVGSDCLGDKCTCELTNTRYQEMSITIGTRKIIYLSPDLTPQDKASLYN